MRSFRQLLLSTSSYNAMISLRTPIETMRDHQILMRYTEIGNETPARLKPAAAGKSSNA